MVYNCPMFSGSFGYSGFGIGIYWITFILFIGLLIAGIYWLIKNAGKK
jgi:hypothetical protein